MLPCHGRFHAYIPAPTGSIPVDIGKMDFKNLHIGLLALQGDYEAHQRHVEQLGAQPVLVKLPAQFGHIDALIMPGGESTTMNILMDRFDLRKPLLDYCTHRPVYATCAGMILLAKKIEDNQSGVETLGLLDIDVIRNGYGRQVHSFDETIEARLDGGRQLIRASFIRAPRVTRIGKEVASLAVYKGDPVLVRQRNILAASFHAELAADTSLLEYFLTTICGGKPVR
jgi:5'-phosphate synthase pdxT subunit